MVGYNFWGTIDTSTGAAEGISKLGNYAQVVGLYIPFKKTNPNAPAEISDLQITPGANGELSAELSWTNPSLTFGGNKLTNLTKIEIYRNEQLVHEITNPTIGEKVIGKIPEYNKMDRLYIELPQSITREQAAPRHKQYL